jgi:hypothetical protein
MMLTDRLVSLLDGTDDSLAANKHRIFLKRDRGARLGLRTRLRWNRFPLVA